MPPFRNPFSARKPATPTGVDPVNDENARPTSDDATTSNGLSKPSVALSIKGSREEQQNEFKLSAVNDSGVYLPPSPPEKKSFWHKLPSTNASSHRNGLNENEAFTISRESFDSYRRSFDISGRSPAMQADTYTSRKSLDSRATPRLPRSVMNGSTFEKPDTTREEGFEDVGLNDEVKQQPKKKSFLSRFGETASENSSTDVKEGSHHGFHLPGRKRGQSGKGAELGSIPRPESPVKRPDSPAKKDGIIR